MQFILITLLSTAAYLENSAVAQTFLLRPVIVLPLVGLWLGDVYSGLRLGLLAELIFIEERPLGTHLVPEPAPALAAVLGGSLLALPAGELLNAWQQLLVLLIGLPAAWGYSALSRFQMQLNERNDHLFEAACARGDRRRFEGLFRRALLRRAGLGWAAALLLTGGAYLLQRPTVPNALIEGSELLLVAVAGIAIASAILAFYRRQWRIYTYVGLTLGVLLIVGLLLMRGDLL